MEIRRLGKTGMQVARIGFGGMTIPKVGVERAVATINKALLSVEERRELEDFGDRLGRGYCLVCEYCLPCPQNIPMPVIAQLLDRQERMNWDWPQVRMEYANFNATIEDCIDCGKCEKRGSHNLPVRERLREAHERFAVSG